LTERSTLSANAARVAAGAPLHGTARLYASSTSYGLRAHSSAGASDAMRADSALVLESMVV
jgi:hypothetical protein